MSPGWHGGRQVAPVRTPDFASDIIWQMSQPLAVLDHSGHLEFANPALLDRGLVRAIFDTRGFLVDRQIDLLRQEVLRHSRGPELKVRAVHSDQAGGLAEVFELTQVPGWTAVVFPASEPPPGKTSELPSAPLMLHELRSPMLAVSQALDRLTQALGRDEADLRAAVSAQSRAVARLLSVLAGLSDLVRAGELLGGPAPAASVSLREVAREVHETFELLAGATGHELVLVEDGDPAVIRGERALLARAVANLVDNALKYSPAPGPVRLVIARRGSLAVVEVWDRGAGVAPADRARIFDPFVRLDPGPGPASTGSGLGLAVVQSVVRGHGGSLSVEWDPERGNVFRMSFLISPSLGRQAEGISPTALNSWSGPHGSIG